TCAGRARMTARPRRPSSRRRPRKSGTAASRICTRSIDPRTDARGSSRRAEAWPAPGATMYSLMARRKPTEYERKRSFEKTPEPRGGKRGGAKAKGNRFVVHEHHARRLHWDLRLEHDGALASWALPRGVPQDPRDNRLAVRTEDHPLEYL